MAYGWIRRLVFLGRGCNLANLKPTTVVPPTLLTANLICMFILHNVAKNCVKSKRDKWTRRCHSRRRCRMSMSSSFFSQLLCLYLLLYKYFLMTLQPKFDLNVHVTHRASAERTPWPKKIEVENKFHAKQRGFPVSTDTDLHTKFEWRNGSTKARSKAYTGHHHPSGGCNNYRWQLKRFLCIFHVSNRASINRCLCTPSPPPTRG